MNRTYTWRNACLAALLAIGRAQGYQPAPPPDVEKRVIAKIGAAGSFLGVGVAEIDAERAKALNLKEERGVEVTRVEQDGPAARGGLKIGDVVLDYNGQRVEGLQQFMRMVHETPAGREVKLSVTRGGSPQTLIVKTAARKGPVARLGDMHMEFPDFAMPNMQFPDLPHVTMSWRNRLLGIEAEPVESQLAQYFGVKEGVLIRSVMKNSGAEKAGLRAGDVIVRLGDNKITSPREVSNALRAAKNKRAVSVVLVREKREMTVSVPIEDDALDAGSRKAAPVAR
ncbi:MAG TPA: PDZ domain-containing protein [Bryobacteraceae bacterium]|nr:PDZ domain-containing protein [Bryobacteraceae bacterium]